MRTSHSYEFEYIWISSYSWCVGGVFLVELLDDDPTQAHHGRMDVAKGGVERCDAQADIIGCAKIGQDVHIVEEREIDAQSFRMSQRHMGAAQTHILG